MLQLDGKDTILSADNLMGGGISQGIAAWVAGSGTAVNNQANVKDNGPVTGQLNLASSDSPSKRSSTDDGVTRPTGSFGLVDGASSATPLYFSRGICAALLFLALF